MIGADEAITPDPKEKEAHPNEIQMPTNHEDVKVDVNDNADIKEKSISEQRKGWARGINIYRLVNGKFQTKEFDEEQKKEA